MTEEFAPPKYIKIVQTLRRRMADGTYPSGSLLPSETQLTKEFGVSRPTVVRALETLKLRGEIEREHGRGSFAKAASPAGDSETVRAGRTALDHIEADSDISLGVVSERAAPKHIARLLGLAEASPALLRQYASRDGGQLTGLVSVWAPPDLGLLAGLADAKPLTVPIRRLLQANAKLRLGYATERLSARHPTPNERSVLDLDPNGCVLGVIASIHGTTGRVLLVVETAMPGELVDLEETYPL
jgi:DNA-binding GntR family transcriptional regulator